MSDNKPFRSINVDCNIKNTYDFVLNSRSHIGHANKINFPNAGKSLKVDTPLALPLDPETKVKTVAAIEHLSWGGGPTDEIVASIRLSPENLSILQEALSSLTGGSELEMEWTLYSYDYNAKKYFKHFHSGEKPLKFVITKGSMVNIDTNPAQDVEHPLNFRVDFSITPKSEADEQEAHIAFNATSPFTRRLGVPVGA